MTRRSLAHPSDRPLLIGVVHLLPLPGAPTPSPGLDEVEQRALADARALDRGGVDGLIIENYGDAPFTPGPVDPWTVASMTRVAAAVCDALPETIVGINVLRNDARAALSVATAVDAAFVRVNVHTGTMVTDQGLITGQARQTLLERNRLGADVAIAADLLVKHAAPLGAVSIEQAARDTWYRGLADVMIVTGSATGQPFDPMDLQRIRKGAPDATLWAGSGLVPETAHAYREQIEGAIVGTWFHEDGEIGRPIDVERVRELRGALEG